MILLNYFQIERKTVVSNNYTFIKTRDTLHLLHKDTRYTAPHTHTYSLTPHYTIPLHVELNSPGPGYFPAASSVKIILSLDKGLRMVEEGECSDADMHLVQSVTDRAKAVIAVASSSDDKTVPALSSVDRSRISSSSERGSDVSVGNPEGDSNASGSMKTLLSNQSALSTGAISSSEEEIEEKQEEDKEGSWDIDEMYVGSTDSYVLYTVCDIRSTIESKPRKGLFDAFLSNEIEQQGEE